MHQPRQPGLQSGSKIILESVTQAKKCDFKETLVCDPEISKQSFTYNEGRCNTTLLHVYNNITKTNSLQG